MQSIQSYRARVAFLVFASLLALAGCQKGGPISLKDIDGKNLVRSGDPQTSRVVGEGETKFLVLGQRALRDQAQRGKVFLTPSAEATGLLERLAEQPTTPAHPSSDTKPEPPAKPPVKPDDSLVVGFPIGLLKEHQVFGAVITAVSDTKSQILGMLKLTDLPPVHVHTVVVNDGGGKFELGLLGCANDCKEGSTESPLLGIPIVGVDQASGSLLLDLASLGDELNFVKMIDPQGRLTKLETKSSKTVAFDYSLSTLVFDVEVKMQPKRDNPFPLLFPFHGDHAEGDKILPRPPAAPAAPETVFNVRWYLKLASTFDPSFEPRGPTEGIGYFLTDRSAAPKIERRVRPAGAEGLSGDGPVKYFIKNVPAEYHDAFASAFDEWNEKFATLTRGQKLFSYEFVNAGDPKGALLVTGDPRYNIVEWDLINVAPYGGLGPALANQYTGEIFSANVYIQGPHIVELYTQWFKASQKIDRLLLAGRDQEAAQLLRDTTVSLHARAARPRTEFQLRLGKQLSFRVPSQEQKLHDGLWERVDFEPPPAGSTYATYMRGYFHDMLTHELGHNLGLRHNFRGNLGANLDPTLNPVSDSIMEYLGRQFRHLDHIGTYDLMAIGYGYFGEAPPRHDLFCTDEDVPTADNHLTGSAECSKDDATTDPFKYLEGELAHAVDLLVARGSAKAPVWTVDDMGDELEVALTGLALYGATAKETAAHWTNFFNGGDRPGSPALVRDFVLAKLRSHLCDQTFVSVLKAKESEEARKKSAANIDALAKKAAAVISPLETYSAEDLKCVLVPL